jgi:hypothetical protein
MLLVNLTGDGVRGAAPAERLARQFAAVGLGRARSEDQLRRSDVPTRALTSSGSIPLLINMTLLVSTITLQAAIHARFRRVW